MRKHEVIIIGGGLAGIMAARTLLHNGIEDVVILDKSRSVGGRLATRRVDGGKVDHGAQFFTVRTPQLQKSVEDWLKKGWVKKWFGDPYPRYTSVDGMNTLAKKLADGIPAILNERAVNVTNEDSVVVQCESGTTYHAKKVLITAPAPQAKDLLSGDEFSSDIKEELSKVTFAPCLVGIFTVEETVPNLDEGGHLDTKVPAGVERIVDHQAKGISDKVTVSVYMNREWSMEHYDLDDQSILAKIKGKVAGMSVIQEQLKRWRYAEAQTVLHKPYLQVDNKIFIAGDAFLTEDDPAGRTRFESAFLSGIAVGEALVKAER